MSAPSIIAQKLQKLKAQLPPHVTLVAVGKTHPVEKLEGAYSAGQRHFGENRVQEMVAKQPQMPNDVCWHMIGHLQTNKVRAMAPFVHLIHSIDRFDLLKVVNKEAERIGRVIDVLIQFHIAQEDSKFGFDRAEAWAMLSSEEYKNLKNIRICGVMGMATFTDNRTQVRAEFRGLRQLFEDLKTEFFPSEAHFKVVSMGMSGDWPLAVEEGSTMVRVGSALFGSR